MNTITKIVVLLTLCLIVNHVNAQEHETDSITNKKVSYKLEVLNNLKTTIQDEEREYLKKEVEYIIQRLDDGEITETEAENLKKEAAKKRALNI